MNQEKNNIFSDTNEIFQDVDSFVFKGRNIQFGSFQLRKKHIRNIFIGLILSFATMASLLYLFSMLAIKVPENEEVKKKKKIKVESVVKVEKKLNILEIKPQKLEKATQKKQASRKAIEPLVVKEPDPKKEFKEDSVKSEKPAGAENEVGDTNKTNQKAEYADTTKKGNNLTTETEGDESYDFDEFNGTLPSFDNLAAYISQNFYNIKKPANVRVNYIVKVTMDIDKTGKGNVTNIQFEPNVPLKDFQIQTVYKAFNKIVWNPGVYNGKAVDLKNVVIPIRIK